MCWRRRNARPAFSLVAKAVRVARRVRQARVATARTRPFATTARESLNSLELDSDPVLPTVLAGSSPNSGVRSACSAILARFLQSPDRRVVEEALRET